MEGESASKATDRMSSVGCGSFALVRVVAGLTFLGYYQLDEAARRGGQRTK